MEKKVYADYHGPRCTRQHDGKTAQWKYFGTAKMSGAEHTCANHNADCINEAGLHDIAALSYPLVGMQSQRDEAYIEYQILTAKLAHIDGFFVEWGFREHESNEELLLMMPIAGKYGFEIGINWCDAWHFYPWIEAFHPDAVTRERKVELSIENVQYLLDELFADKTGARFNNHPLILLFGGGFTKEEFRQVKQAQYRLPVDCEAPYFLTRAAIAGRETDGQVRYMAEENGWSETADGIFGWIPTRVRNGLVTQDFCHWDRYALTEDTVEYLNVLREAARKVHSKVRISSVNPQMDNRACASWNKFDLSCIPRENGRTYEEMWKNNVEHREDVDIVYIVSWNDYTERHQIEPTLTDGFRELETTRKYAALFKENVDEGTCRDFEAPYHLFRLRKQAEKLAGAGWDMEIYRTALDQAGLLISERRIEEAELLLDGVENMFKDLERQLLRKQILIKGESDRAAEGCICITDREALQCMDEWAYDGWLYFSYLDESGESFQICHRQQELCDIKMDHSGQWKKTSIRIFKENMKDVSEEPVLKVKGKVRIKEVSLMIQAYRKWKGWEGQEERDVISI